MSNKLLSTLRSLETGDSTARSLLAVVEESAARFADFNALCFADWTHAKRQADALDEAARAGHRKGPLHGAPLSIKDLFGVKGMPMKAGCRAALPAHLPAQGEFDSAPAKAWRDAGALLFCKTNMHEIALGITELHGGTISAANRDDGGCEFTISLPIDPATDRTLPPVPAN